MFGCYEKVGLIRPHKNHTRKEENLFVVPLENSQRQSAEVQTFLVGCHCNGSAQQLCRDLLGELLVVERFAQRFLEILHHKREKRKKQTCTRMDQESIIPTEIRGTIVCWVSTPSSSNSTREKLRSSDAETCALLSRLFSSRLVTRWPDSVSALRVRSTAKAFSILASACFAFFGSVRAKIVFTSCVAGTASGGDKKNWIWFFPAKYLSMADLMR